MTEFYNAEGRQVAAPQYNRDSQRVSFHAQWNPVEARQYQVLTRVAPEEEPDPIPYDTIVYTFNETRLPGAFKSGSLTLSRDAGNLHAVGGTQDLDAYPEKALPAGRHDLIKDVELELSIKTAPGSVGSYVIDLPTIGALGGECYFDCNTCGKADHVTGLVQFYEVEKGPVYKKLVSREITGQMREFMFAFPGQTADTLETDVEKLKDYVMVKYSPEGGETSAIMMWYHGLLNSEGRPRYGNPDVVYINNVPHANLPKGVYEECLAQARREIGRYISLGDATSKDFCIRIAPYRSNGRVGEGVGLGSFDFHFPERSRTATRPGFEGTAEGWHNLQPITIAGRLVVTYKKVHTGADSD